MEKIQDPLEDRTANLSWYELLEEEFNDSEDTENYEEVPIEATVGPQVVTNHVSKCNEDVANFEVDQKKEDERQCWSDIVKVNKEVESKSIVSGNREKQGGVKCKVESTVPGVKRRAEEAVTELNANVKKEVKVKEENVNIKADINLNNQKKPKDLRVNLDVETVYSIVDQNKVGLKHNEVELKEEVEDTEDDAKRIEHEFNLLEEDWLIQAKQEKVEPGGCNSAQAKNEPKSEEEEEEEDCTKSLKHWNEVLKREGHWTPSLENGTDVLMQSPSKNDGKRKRARKPSKHSPEKARDSSASSNGSSNSHTSKMSRSDRQLELETDPATLNRRQKQIDYGKNTVGYDRYIQSVPRYKRTREHPKTPPKHVKYSRRAWDGLVRIWRQRLHEWDPPNSGEQTPSAQSLSDICVELDENSSRQTRLKPSAGNSDHDDLEDFLRVDVDTDDL